MKQWRKELNEEQRRAAEAPNGPVLIVAGPGTGKTKTLTARISFLMEQGITPNQILALTFTNRAARDMQARLTMTPLPHVTTFHAFCQRMLTESRGEPLALIPNAERQQLIRELKTARTLRGLSVRELELHLSLLKNRIEPSEDELLEAYQHALADRGWHDFDDLLRNFYELLKTNEEQRASLKRRYRAILIDEFQDTNALQYEILKLLNGEGNVFVIGDPLQAIYGFRGSSGEIFDRFKADWPAALCITLRSNYRSTPDIVSLGCRVFPDALQLTAHRQEKGSVRCVQVLNEYSEANWIIAAIEQHIGGSTMLRGSEHQASEQKSQSFRDFAVLYRTHRTSAVLRRLLDESGLPYQVVGEGSPYTKEPISTIINELRKLEYDNPQPVSQLIAQKAKALGFDTNSSDMRTFINTAVRFDDDGLTAYLKHLDTMAEQEFYDTQAEAITLLTIHAAKGLEFKHVFLIGAEDGIVPHHSPHHDASVDEERRLFYVAITRARDHLDILHTKKRHGQSSQLSPFVAGLTPSVLPRIIDPDMATQQERLHRRAIKRSQTSLFN